MPWTDWQFWMVTLAALWGGRVVVRQIVPSRADEAPVCGSCAAGAAACAKPEDDVEPLSELPVVSNRR